LNSMLYRTLGKTGEKVSAIGLGGYHVGHPSDPADAIQIVHSAIDRGITFMDNSWDYHGGESERRVGIALRDGLRQKVFLMTKFDGRTKDATARQIDESFLVAAYRRHTRVIGFLAALVSVVASALLLRAAPKGESLYEALMLLFSCLTLGATLVLPLRDCTAGTNRRNPLHSWVHAAGLLD
jgi:hypothetical protein